MRDDTRIGVREIGTPNGHQGHRPTYFPQGIEKFDDSFLDAHESVRDTPHLCVSVPGFPVGQARSRDSGVYKKALQRIASGRCGNAQAIAAMALKQKAKHFTPAKTDRYRSHVASVFEGELLRRRAMWMALPAHGKKINPWLNPVVWPTSLKVWCRCWIHFGNQGKRPDAINVCKAIEDALSGILWIAKSGKPNDQSVLCGPEDANIGQTSENPRVNVLVHL